MNIIELKNEAAKQGYNVVKKVVYNKFVNCKKCGSKKISNAFCLVGRFCYCRNCGNKSTLTKFKYEAINKWNEENK